MPHSENAFLLVFLALKTEMCSPRLGSEKRKARIFSGKSSNEMLKILINNYSGDIKGEFIILVSLSLGTVEIFHKIFRNV